MKALSKMLQGSKSHEGKTILEKLNYYSKKESSENTYRAMAYDKFRKIDDSLVKDEEVFIDEDALVSEDTNGAYVHAWIYVDNKPKVRKGRKKVS